MHNIKLQNISRLSLIFLISADSLYAKLNLGAMLKLVIDKFDELLLIESCFVSGVIFDS